MQFKDFLAESLNKEYSYRVKIAADCNADHLAVIEKALGKYNVVSVADFKRKPISENPVEFSRTKGVKFVSEVCSTDVVVGYPVNSRILEVWLAVNLGIDHDRVLCYDVKDPRRLQSEQAEERAEAITKAEAEVARRFGETKTTRTATNKKIKDEKGADYFRNYPSKGELMGDALRPTWDSINNVPNMGAGQESSKEVTTINQSGGIK